MSVVFLCSSNLNRLKLSQQLIRAFGTSQNEFFIINAVGPDRPGIVSDVTKLVVEQGGNVGESQASKLGSHFGLMMLIEIPKGKVEVLQEAVTKISDISTSCYLTNDPNAVEIVPKVGCESILLHYNSHIDFFVFEEG